MNAHKTWAYQTICVMKKQNSSMRVKIESNVMSTSLLVQYYIEIGNASNV